jgi:hypothetical protein
MPLYVFDDLARAEEHLYNYSLYGFYTDYNIYECEVTNPRKVRYLANLSNKIAFNAYVKNKKLKRKISDLNLWTVPSHTVAVDSVRLIKNEKMKIKVTDLETNQIEIYNYSNNNWLGRYACIKNGVVHMWAPKNLVKGLALITSGRRWELYEN